MFTKIIPRFVLLLPAALLVGGCPGTGSGDDVPEGVFVQADAPRSVEKGASVALSASLSEDVGDVSYRWWQLFGRAVTLENADSAAASFIAPALQNASTLGFRVDASRGNSVISSAEIRVTVQADPNFGIDEDDAPVDGGDAELFPQVKLTTSLGDIVIELNREKAPLTVNNFLRYVDDGFYDGLIFHRVIADFVIQSGGFEPGLVERDNRGTILNEASNGLKNVRGSIAMARTNDPNSARSQWYINVVDNEDLDFREGFPGYCVFGRVLTGFDVMDEIAAVETETRSGFADVPVDDVLLETAARTSGVVEETDDGADNGNSNDNGGRPLN